MSPNAHKCHPNMYKYIQVKPTDTAAALMFSEAFYASTENVFVRLARSVSINKWMRDDAWTD